MSKKTAIGIFVVIIAATLIASGALLSYYGSIETKVNVEQSLRLDGLVYSTGHADITINNDLGTFVAGCCEWGGCHNLYLHSLACDPVSTKVSSVVSPVDGGLTTMIAAEVQGAGADFSNYETPTSCDITVPTDYTTIQAAIDGATAFDTICVGPGTYVEDVNVNKDITLVALNSPISGSKAIVQGTIDVSATGATVKGLRVDGLVVTGQKAAIKVSASDVTIDSNVVYDMTGDGSGTIKGIHVYSTTEISNILLTNNWIEKIHDTGKGSIGIMVQGHLDGVTVTYNTVKDIHSNMNDNTWDYATGIEDTPASGYVGSPLEIVVTDNHIEDIVSVAEPGRGFTVDYVDTSNYADATEVTLSRNNFYDIPNDITNKDQASGHTLVTTDNWFGCDGVHVNVNGAAKDEVGAITIGWNTWAHDDVITLDPDETVYFMIQYCTPDNAVGDYTSTVEFLPYP